MTDIAEKLEALANRYIAVIEFAEIDDPPQAEEWTESALLLRSAASLIREQREALEPFAKAAEAATVAPLSGLGTPDEETVWAHSFDVWERGTGATTAEGGVYLRRVEGRLIAADFRRAALAQASELFEP